MSTSKLRFYICQECGPAGLHAKLQAMKTQLAKEGVSVEIYHSICLSACKFNRVVKVQLPDGQVFSYSDQEMNGFRKWDSDPIVQITHEYLSHKHPVSS